MERKYPNIFGLYKIVKELTQHGRNVWKHVDYQKFLFYGRKYWMIGEDYTKNEGWFESSMEGLETFPATNWTHLDGEEKVFEGSLVIEPWNPDILEVSSTGPAASVHDVKMGIYTKIEGISINENNVWKHASGRQFIYFMNNVWMIGSDYSNSISGIKTKDKDNMMISDNT